MEATEIPVPGQIAKVRQRRYLVEEVVRPPRGGDSTLVRCTFDWNQSHYAAQKFSPANVYADRVQFCFRPEPPRAVQGEIASVTNISDTQVEVRTRSYTNSSVVPAQTVTPTVVPGDEPRFVGSSFASKQILYES